MRLPLRLTTGGFPAPSRPANQSFAQGTLGRSFPRKRRRRRNGGRIARVDTARDVDCNASCEAICEKAIEGTPITPDEALLLYRNLDLPSLGLVADAIRQRMNPGDKVTYIIDRNVNPTNVCITDCGFCAFYRRPGREMRPFGKLTGNSSAHPNICPSKEMTLHSNYL